MIDIADFEMVETIVATGSLTRASEALHVSQPTLSKRLARLEDQLGAKLFHRLPSGLKATHIATYLVESADAVKGKVASVQRHVERILNHDQGEVRIGVGPIIEQVLLPSVLIKLAQHSGHVRYSVLTERASVLIEQLKTGALDVIAGPFGRATDTLADDGIESVDLIAEQTINIARSDHPIFSTKQTNFLDYPYASPPLQGAMTSDVPSGLDRQRLSSDNYTLLKKVAMQTDYICGGPRAVFQSELAAGTMQEVTNSPSLAWRSACLYKSEALETPLVRLVVETMVACRDEYAHGLG